jgi:hypothetical protein
MIFPGKPACEAEATLLPRHLFQLDSADSHWPSMTPF